MAETKSTGLLSWYLRVNLLKKIMIALVAGGIVGVFLGTSPEMTEAFVKYASVFGDIFVRLLKMIVVPVIFFSLISGSASIPPSQLGRVGGKTLLYYLVTSISSVGIALLIGHLMQPGIGLELAQSAGTIKKAVAPALSSVLLNVIPTNPVESLAKGDVLPIIFFALTFGISLAICRDSKDKKLSAMADNLFHVCSAAAETMYKVVRGIMQYAPIGVFVLIATVFATQGPKVLGPLLYVTITIYVAFILQYLFGYCGLLALFKINPLKFTKGAYEAMVTAFVTRSSSATLPISMRVAEDNLGVPRSISSFCLPVGATVNMDGTAIYVAICAVFISLATGQPLTMDQNIVIMFTATLAAIGAAGVPGAGAIMLLMVMESIGMPIVEGSNVTMAYAMLLGIDALLDMGRTCLNVTGDIVGVTIVAKAEKVLDQSKMG